MRVTRHRHQHALLSFLRTGCKNFAAGSHKTTTVHHDEMTRMITHAFRPGLWGGGSVFEEDIIVSLKVGVDLRLRARASSLPVWARDPGAVGAGARTVLVSITLQPVIFTDSVFVQGASPEGHPRPRFPAPSGL